MFLKLYYYIIINHFLGSKVFISRDKTFRANVFQLFSSTYYESGFFNKVFKLN